MYVTHTRIAPIIERIYFSSTYVTFTKKKKENEHVQRFKVSSDFKELLSH